MEYDPEREQYVLKLRDVRAKISGDDDTDDDPRTVFTPNTWQTIIPDFAHVRRDALVVTHPVTDVYADEVLGKSQDREYILRENHRIQQKLEYSFPEINP